MLQLTCARTCRFVSYYFSNVCGFNLYKWQLLISTIKYSSILLHLPVPLTVMGSSYVSFSLCTAV